MKKTITLLSVLVFSLFTLAQESEKAKKILDEVSVKTKSYKTIKANFSFTLENIQEEIAETHNGSIKIKGNKYTVDLMDTKTYFDGKALYTYLIDAEEVNISEPGENDEGGLNPAKIFSMYESGFKFRFIGEKVESGKTLYEIDLYPENHDKPFSRIKLLINKSDLTLNYMKQVGKDGNNYIIKVNKFETNQPYNDSEFTFNKQEHPNVEVIDMR
ncbi:MAG: outer membrane lipoprotein carrier protein LolA [Marinilabiliaceae bacterium]|nr:outer membrane lipoprotein carrier protein LolA [Marinilabiliaceae bacterium]